MSAAYKWNGAQNCGACYVYKRLGNNWSRVQQLWPTQVVAYGSYGVAVSVTQDTILVGASGDDTRGSYAGAA